MTAPGFEAAAEAVGMGKAPCSCPPMQEMRAALAARNDLARHCGVVGVPYERGFRARTSVSGPSTTSTYSAMRPVVMSPVVMPPFTGGRQIGDPLARPA